MTVGRTRYFRFSGRVGWALVGSVLLFGGCALQQQTGNVQNKASNAVNTVKRSTAEIVEQAKKAYDGAKNKGQDMRNGPCLGEIAPDWVVDIAHNPREKVDELQENQCAAYRDGTAHHFIELTPQGSLIRIY